jgi:hypothetical protein
MELCGSFGVLRQFGGSFRGRLCIPQRSPASARNIVCSKQMNPVSRNHGKKLPILFAAQWIELVEYADYVNSPIGEPLRTSPSPPRRSSTASIVAGIIKLSCHS